MRPFTFVAPSSLHKNFIKLVCLSPRFFCRLRSPIERTIELWIDIHFHYRGFGFVTFADPESIEKVLKVGRHEIDEKMVCHFSSSKGWTRNILIFIQIDPKVAFPKKSTPKVSSYILTCTLDRTSVFICPVLSICNISWNRKRVRKQKKTRLSNNGTI